MKLNVGLRLGGLLLATAVAGVGCSGGSSSGGKGGNTPRGVSDGIIGDYTKPQAANPKALAYLKSHAGKSNVALPEIAILLNNDVNADGYKKLDTTGKDWFRQITQNCTVTNPPKMDQDEGTHTRTESIQGGGACPISYMQSEYLEMSKTQTSSLISIRGRGSVKQETEILDPRMQADTDSVKSSANVNIDVLGEATLQGERVTGSVLKFDVNGRMNAVTLHGTVTADFRAEMSAIGSEDSSTVNMVIVANVHTPEGDVSLGMRMQNGTLEMRVGGKVVTPEEFGEIFGPLPVGKGNTFLASGQ